MQLTGLHHLTAVTAQASRNHKFYTETLGMRLVKKTVNQDDVSAYHLFYADGLASPGSDLTFFDWPVGRERRGTHSIARTGLRVSGQAAIDWWLKRFKELGIAHQPAVERDGRVTIDFEDFEGQRLMLVDDGGIGEGHSWDKSPVPAEYQIRGLGPVIMSVPDLKPTDAVLTRVMNMTPERTYMPLAGSNATTHVYRMKGEGPAARAACRGRTRSAAGAAGCGRRASRRLPDAR